MASLPICAPASHPIVTHRRPSAGFPIPPRAFGTPIRHNFVSHPNVRLKMEARLQVKKKRFIHVLASNMNPSDGSDNEKRGDIAPGPPLLTILAGVFVFLFVCWVIGSILTWLIGLIVHPPPLK